MEHIRTLDIRIQLIEGGIIPRYTYEGDAGLDCYARLDQDLLLMPAQWASNVDDAQERTARWCQQRRIDRNHLHVDFIHPVPLGVAIELPDGYEAQIRPRSGLSLQGLICPNSPATIDSGYRGEVHFIAANLSAKPFLIKNADRICQMLILPVPRVNLVISEELSPSQRGTQKFGSSGIE
ncbi:dUTP diphosphatase [Desulfurispirillum indicum]|uniref:dUTP diphosphatase n=1 Tax=Desulfurispirillum indicum TaxID=936456 RepID=UPI001CFA2ACA|nr:dUTP diphosphatase [Desulfurispirillum indicum]UCZ57767.1 dUTP diphosphatase [Desulfurispirillum indicum]